MDGNSVGTIRAVSVGTSVGATVDGRRNGGTPCVGELGAGRLREAGGGTPTSVAVGSCVGDSVSPLLGAGGGIGISVGDVVECRLRVCLSLRIGKGGGASICARAVSSSIPAMDVGDAASVGTGISDGSVGCGRWTDGTLLGTGGIE